MKRIATAIIAAFIACAAAVAQDNIRHEFTVNAGGGLSGLQARPTLGDTKMKGAFYAGVGYHYLLNPTWGLLTGINLAVYNGSIAGGDNDQTQQTTNKWTGNPLDFMVTSPGYSEKQRAVMINIPIMAQYRYYGLGKAVLYGAAGFKAGIPVAAKATPEGAYTTKGYSSSTNVTYEDLPDYGFVTNQPVPDDKTKLGMKFNVMASLEAGAQWTLGGKTRLYTGIYTDIGINNTLKRNVETVRNLVVYQADTPAQAAYNTATDSYARRMSPFAAGVSVRWVFLTK